MYILSLFYVNMRTTNHLIPKIFECVSFVHVHSPNKGKLDLRAIKYIFVRYSSTQKGYKCYHPLSKKFFVSTNVIVTESESYFLARYLQGENSIKEDKDQDSYLIGSFFIHLPIVSGPMYDLTSVPYFFEFKSSNPASVPLFFEPESSQLELVPEYRMVDKVYSRKKVAVPKLIRVQESELAFGNEVIVCHPSSQTELEL